MLRKASRGATRAPMRSPRRVRRRARIAARSSVHSKKRWSARWRSCRNSSTQRDCRCAAAGGIMDGRGIVAALALGAQAAVMGTAFLTSRESAIPQAWKDRLRSISDTSTSVTYAITGRHARGIRNPLMQRLERSAAEDRAVSRAERIDAGVASDGRPRAERRLSVAVVGARCAARPLAARGLRRGRTDGPTRRRMACGERRHRGVRRWI